MIPWVDLLAGLSAAGNFLAACRLVCHSRAAHDLWPSSQAPPSLQGAPLVSILIPARNEADGIEACVKGALSQQYSPFEVIVCDDDSNDGTGAILDRLAATDPRLRVVHRQGPPPSPWVGKNFALHTALQAARGDWILGVDADCLLSRWALPAAMIRAVKPDDGVPRSLVSALPHVDCENVACRTMMPAFGYWLALAMPMHEVNDPRRRAALAAGGFLLVEKSALEAIGGYERLAPHIVEDALTARLVKSTGRRIELFLARQCVSTTMYSGWRDLWEGITKNAFAGVDFRMSMAGFAILSILTIAVLPAAALATAAASWMIDESLSIFTPLSIALFAFSAGILTAIHAAISRELRSPVLYGLLAAPAHLIYACALAVSAARGTFGSGVSWKGRRYYGAGGGVPADKLLT